MRQLDTQNAQSTRTNLKEVFQNEGDPRVADDVVYSLKYDYFGQHWQLKQAIGAWGGNNRHEGKSNDGPPVADPPGEH